MRSTWLMNIERARVAATVKRKKVCVSNSWNAKIQGIGDGQLYYDMDLSGAKPVQGYGIVIRMQQSIFGRLPRPRLIRPEWIVLSILKGAMATRPLSRSVSCRGHTLGLP